MKNFNIKNIIVIVLLIIISISAVITYRIEIEKRILQADVIELSDIKYGMFNVDVWMEQFSKILTKKVEELNLVGEDREDAARKIRSFLYETINEFEANYKAENKRNAFLGISLKNAGSNFFKIFESLKVQVPEITEGILDFLNDEENRESIKKYILTQLNDYKESTFQKIDYTLFNDILSKYNATDATATKPIILKEIERINNRLTAVNFILLLAFISLLISMFLIKGHSRITITAYVIAALHLLILGIYLPMIAIDARISSMEFQLMGEPISFYNQVLYFRSKSIIEVSQTMLIQEKVKIMIVGFLVLLFSVIFPVAKLISSLLLVFKRKLQQNKIIQFLVFKSGKWSMADVMVVAIFMSYIGFAGIITSQLNQLENITYSIKILTTNESELQYGFYFFLGFVIMSLFISQTIQKLFEEKTKD
ncbi:hypothetical protein IMCC3317_37230 [Kordia antarctica]|uniref:Paraquat-inducible protein A n=1 Tax=Kordia antarctica TaxID=1218801 RepID=A0A7L4ZNU6_9FLAO|nr:paraquat-inducible protein A [Kordia antarctica]QHI38332.1 hypothetical protein IMCC3317_37230 [Kordia antarctica]